MALYLQNHMDTPDMTKYDIRAVCAHCNNTLGEHRDPNLECPILEDNERIGWMKDSAFWPIDNPSVIIVNEK